MTKTNKLFSWVLLSVLSLSLVIGYAAVCENLSITGSASYENEQFEGVYISDASILSQTSVSNVSFEYKTPTNFQVTVGSATSGGKVTFKITVHNNTDVTYWYAGDKYLAEYASNSLIGSSTGITIVTKDQPNDSAESFNTEDWIPPQTYRDFYVTYSFGSSARGTTTTLVNYAFEIRIDAVHDQFLAALNDKILGGGYSQLTEAFDGKYINNGGTIISNIGSEEAVFDSLFGNDLKINIDGEEKPVTVMVRRENVDKKTATGDTYPGSNAPTGCEYTLYITVDDLDKASGRVTVYAITYTCGADGKWYQIGELYEGTCEMSNKDYDPSTPEYEASFDLYNWVATQKTYNVTENISYKVGYPQGTDYDKLFKLEDLMSVNDQEFYNKVNNSSGSLLKPVCNIIYSYSRRPDGQYDEYTNSANSGKSGYEALKVAFDKIKPYCLIANGAQDVRIQNANSLSRAELIQILEDIQHKYDYYLEVNSN